jgi:hypothetical protein
MRFEAGPSNQKEQIKRKKVGVRKYSSKSHVAAMTNTPTPQPQLVPGPSAAQSQLS